MVESFLTSFILRNRFKCLMVTGTLLVQGNTASCYLPQTKFGARQYVYRCVSVHRGVSGLGGGAWSGGSGPRVCLFPGGGTCSGRFWSGGACSGGCLVEIPAERLLLRAVRILLECILVMKIPIQCNGSKL